MHWFKIVLLAWYGVTFCVLLIETGRGRFERKPNNPYVSFTSAMLALGLMTGVWLWL